MTDAYATSAMTRRCPSRSVIEITPSDTTDLEKTVRAIYVGSGGDITLVTPYDETITFKNVAAGGFFPQSAKKILANGTTATNLIGVVI